MSTLLRVARVSKAYGATRAVEDVSLEIAGGEFFALLGPSGCGKTTLMRMIAGFETPDVGSVYLDGEDVTQAPPHKRAVNLMFQSYALFPHMDVAANVAYPLRRQGLAAGVVAQRVRDMLRLVQMEGFEARKPHRLSGGQKARVALARALAGGPKLLLLDEPLAALDRKLREETQFELMQVQRDLRLSFLVVTHDQSEAMAMAGRMAVMREGRIAQLGAPRDVYERPASAWVADFIGAANLIHGRVRALAPGRAILDTALGALSAGVDEHAPPAQDSSAVIAVRAERLRLHATRPDDENAFEAEVVDEVYLGGVIEWRLRAGQGAVALRASALAAQAGADSWRGARVFVSFAREAARVLPS
jgi:putrescine transport system ATP-binding protein